MAHHIRLGVISVALDASKNLQDQGRMAELVDALVLGTSGAIHGGSSPLPPTKVYRADLGWGPAKTLILDCRTAAYLSF